MKRIALALLLGLAPNFAFACACGCGVFDVGTSTMLPTHEGGMAWLEYDYMDQTQNFHDSSKAPAANNDDKRIRSNFMVAGAQYMFDRSWGVMATVPYTDRLFSTADSGPVQTFNHAAFGDVHISGVYSGFSPDMSTGITFGLKLPTGDFRYANFDRDVSIGSGSTDVLLGAYHMGNLVRQWDWFADGQLDQPVLIQQDYRPGTEADASLGVYYNGWSIGGVKVAPIAQIIGSQRWHDRGAEADPDNSGYQRLLLSPGIEVDTAGGERLYADVAFPIYQHVNGNQLTAPALFKVNVSHRF